MKFEEFRRQLGQLEVFDDKVARHFLGDYAAIQISRWKKAGKIIALRRGLYLWEDKKSRQDTLAGVIYSPSYISLGTALSRYGLIADVVVEIESVTMRHGAFFQTPVGTFSYRRISRDLWDGYQDINGVVMATPEKAIIDLWHLEEGEWTVERQQEMRWQNIEEIEWGKLQKWARGRPRLERALKTFDNAVR